MKKMLLLAAGFVAFGVMSVVGLLWWHGAFLPITIEEGTIGPYVFVYEDYVGDYSTVGPVMDRIYNALQGEYGVVTMRGMGIYLDNPGKVPKEKCRSQVGSILEEAELNKRTLIEQSFKVMDVPEIRVLKASFPYKTKLSFIIGVIKVYPAFGKYMAENGLDADMGYEVYDISGGEIIYAMPLIAENRK